MSISITIDTSDLIKVKGRMEERMKKIDSATNRIVKKIAFLIARYGAIYAPVKTGRLRASIVGGSRNGYSFSKNAGVELFDKSAIVGPTVEYAKYVHRRIPFMRAARDSHVPEIQEIVRKEIENAIK